MTTYRSSLPLLKGDNFLTDGGLETTLVFHRGIDLAHFAAFPLLDAEKGRKELNAYFDSYLGLASRYRVGFVLDTVTWRANPDWGPRLGYDLPALRALIIRSVAFAVQIRKRWEAKCGPIVLDGVIGPRGDGYKDGNMDPSEAEDYHSFQVEAFADSEADMISAITMNNVGEAVGIAKAARAHGMPCVISLTVETNGRLASGTALQEAVETIDKATGGYPAYYMVNCAHPTHFDTALAAKAKWVERVAGIRANASEKSHGELDLSPLLDIGDPVDLGRRYKSLMAKSGALRILGGCCGTDHRHLAAICAACLSPAIPDRAGP